MARPKKYQRMLESVGIGLRYAMNTGPLGAGGTDAITRAALYIANNLCDENIITVSEYDRFTHDLARHPYVPIGRCRHQCSVCAALPPGHE